MKYYIIRYENGKVLYYEGYRYEYAEDYAESAGRGWNYIIEEYCDYAEYQKNW